MDCFASLAMTMVRLVIVSRHADLTRNVVIPRRELHAGTGGVLADGGTVELLPRRLVGRVREASLGLQIGVAFPDLLLGDQDIGRALVEVDADLVAVLQDREPAIGGGLRR